MSAQGVQGIAIGTNDLTQLLLGVDRDHALLASRFEARHPAVKAAIARLIEQAISLVFPVPFVDTHPPKTLNSSQIWCAGALRPISVDPGAVEATYWAIVQAERQLLLETVRD
jgi:pyruvate,water dikinase